jgi:hypothetical protein
MTTPWCLIARPRVSLLESRKKRVAPGSRLNVRVQPELFSRVTQSHSLQVSSASPRPRFLRGTLG